MNPMEKFGKFFVENCRDKALDHLRLILDGHWKTPELQRLQNKASSLSPELKATVYELADELLTQAMTDLLFAFHMSHDNNLGIEIMVDGKPIANLSDGLHGNLFGKEGWIVRYSKVPSEAETVRSLEFERFIKDMLKTEAERDNGQ